jgi:hypothetical protein
MTELTQQAAAPAAPAAPAPPAAPAGSEAPPQPGLLERLADHLPHPGHGGTIPAALRADLHAHAADVFDLAALALQDAANHPEVTARAVTLAQDVARIVVGVMATG